MIAILGGVLGCILSYLVFNGMTVTSIISSGGGGGGKTVVLRLHLRSRRSASAAWFSAS